MPVDEEWCCEGWSPVACKGGLHKPEPFNCGIKECAECIPPSVPFDRLVITEQI